MKNKRKIILAIIIIFLVALFFRVGNLDRMLLGDELKWVSRSTKFFNEFISGNFRETFSTAHPGVTLMWTSGGSFWFYSKISGQEAMFQEIAKTDSINPVFPEKYFGAVPIILKVMRLALAFLSSFLILIIFLLLKKIIGFKTAFLGSLTVALDPFLIANNREVHLDGLLALFMALSVLSLAAYLKTENKKFLYLTGVFTGFSLLTKLPSFFLLPFFVLIFLIYYLKKEKSIWLATKLTIKKSFFVLILAFLIFIVFWPAMWVSPIKSLYRGDSIHSIFSNIPYEIETPHKSNFFLGKQTENVGFLFYPVTILFKTTPFSLIFFLIAIMLLVFKKKKNRPLVLFLLFIILFVIVMSIGAKKGDRYILPIYPFIDILAAFALYQIIKMTPRLKKPAFAISTFILIILGIHIFTYNPYFIAYFNPIAGGGNAAKKAYVIGLGEGLNLAASYLNQKENAENLKVAAWYSSSFKPFFNGKTFSEGEIGKKEIDYVVLYLNGIQRKLPKGAYNDYFLRETPEKVIEIKRTPYVWIYKK